ncbi:MAG: Arm DNA-binding domain-containing protein, partial [Paracoccaceae bacterium]|nr:Arm DNA-binding domain-containing protein [Paracoccaceae bacterium]
MPSPCCLCAYGPVTGNRRAETASKAPRTIAECQYRTLTKRTVDHLSVNGKDAGFLDNELPGFGVRVYPSGKKVFVVQTRALGRSKRVSLGTHGDTDFSVNHARKMATDVIAHIKDGQPPVAPEPARDPTVADLAERYEREYVAM